eukprot:2466570-Prymnesium_polylepis.1
MPRTAAPALRLPGSGVFLPPPFALPPLPEVRPCAGRAPEGYIVMFGLSLTVRRGKACYVKVRGKVAQPSSGGWAC